ncbi:MAG: tetratricopeptide repeat protein, partial [Gammaproteobacteria bacterium]
DARAATKRAIRLNPTYGRAQTNLSIERITGGRDSAPFEVPAEPEEQAPTAHYNLGLAFRRQGYYQEALREYRLALELGEDRWLLRNAMAEVHLLLRDHPAALSVYDSLLAEVEDSPKLWNERGVVLHQMGRMDEAIESYKKSVEHSPKYALALNNLAIALAQEGQHEEASATFAESVRADPNLVTPQLNLGLLLLKLKRLQLALEAYRKVLETEPDNAPTWNGIGLVLNELGRPDDARNAFARSVEADPELAEAHYNLSFALSSLGDYDGALRAVTRAQSIDPYYVPQRFRLAIDLQYEDPTISVIPEISADVTADQAQDVSFDQGLIDDLFAELEQTPSAPEQEAAGDPFAVARDYLNKGLLDLATAETDRAAARGADKIEALVLSAHIFSRRGLHGESLERYRSARTLDPDRADARLGELRQLLALGRGANAVDDAAAFVAEYPADVDALVALAECRLAAGDPALALESLKVARGRAPQRADLLKLEGDIAVGMGDLETAQKAYQGALALNPRFAQVQADLGRVHEAREDWNAAESSYRAALDSLPSFSEAALALARVYRKAGRPKLAVNLLVEVLSGDPSDLEALLGLGHSLLEDGRLDRGLEAFGRILAHDDKHVGAHFFAGVVLARLRRYSEAVQEWDQVISIEPDGPFAREARKHARSALDLKHIFKTGVA